jgi:hypothetical protein
MFYIPMIYSPTNFGELFFEHNADIRQKDHLRTDTTKGSFDVFDTKDVS